MKLVAPYFNPSGRTYEYLSKMTEGNYDAVWYPQFHVELLFSGVEDDVVGFLYRNCNICFVLILSVDSDSII